LSYAGSREREIIAKVAGEPFNVDCPPFAVSGWRLVDPDSVRHGLLAITVTSPSQGKTAFE